MNNLWFGMSIRDSIQQPRVHAQWVPENVFAETRMPKEIVEALKMMGHNVSWKIFKKPPKGWSFFLLFSVSAGDGATPYYSLHDVIRNFFFELWISIFDYLPFFLKEKKVKKIALLSKLSNCL